MQITKIKRIGTTNRFHVYLDEQWAGVFSDEILATYSLKTNQEIDSCEFEKIKMQNDEKVSFDMAVSYLERYVVSEKGVRDYLKKKGFEGVAVSKTLEKLKEYALVDDERFAKSCFESASASKGKRAIANKLFSKGVSKQIIDDLLENVSDEDEFEKAQKAADKFIKNRQNDAKTKQKCIAHLIYKGYDYSVAQKAANSALLQGENDDWI